MIKILEFSKLLGCGITEFEKVNNSNYKKEYHPNNESYSILINDNEYIFVDDELHSIEIREDLGYPSGLEDLILLFENKSVKWEIFQKYSYAKNIVIRVEEHVFLEYSYDTNKFILDTIRISNNE